MRLLKSFVPQLNQIEKTVSKLDSKIESQHRALERIYEKLGKTDQKVEELV